MIKNLALLLVLAPAVSLAAEASDDPHAFAHERGGVGHQLTVRKIDSAVEVLGKGTVQLFGARKVYDCKTGALVADFACDPCEIPLATYAQQPKDQWMATFMWKKGDDRDKESQLSLARHFAKYFDMYPAGGQDRGETELALWAFKGPRNAGPQGIARIVMQAGGQKGVTTHTLPPGVQDLEVSADALSPAGLELDVPLSFSSACATVSPTGNRKAKVTLMAGKERCEIVAQSPNAPGVKGALLVSRAVKVEILYEKQKVDELALPAGAGAVDLTAEVAVASATPDTTFQPDLQWMVEPGSGELKVLAADKVRFTLAKGAAKGTVVVRDAKSGAEDKVVFTRAP